MRILIDTNILIHLEDNKVIDQKFSKFYNFALANDCKIFYHPQAIPKDINRDKNAERKSIILSKLQKYQKYENPVPPTSEFLSQLTNNRINDQIDNLQLFQIYRNLVDIFVTQDLGIHTKAVTLGINDKVLDIEKALELFAEKYTIIIPSHPILKEHSVRELEKDFDTPFFDSLKQDYDPERFKNWLQKCIINNRKCYSLKVDNELIALLIYNIEKTEEHQIPSIYEKALKICTLKVSDNAFGLKLGELFLNKMFEYCINQKINYLYLTVYERQEHLISLLELFGFEKDIFTNKQGLSEIRMIKCLDKSKIEKTENHISLHPFYYDNEAVNKYVIPIQPKFYETLFKDGKLREPTLFDDTEDSLNEIQGNTIVKAYISNARIKSIKQGDIVLFYSSQTNKVIEPIGILETVEQVTDFDVLWNIVRKKTVYQQEELQQWLEEKKKLHVITFRLVTYLKKKINLTEIQTLDSYGNKFQTITKLQETDYQKLKKNGYFDKCYIIN